MIHKKIKLLFALLLTLQMILPSSILAAAVGQFTSVIGQVTQTRAGVAIKPAVKAAVETTDLIATGDKSTASIFFTDESALTLAPNSKLEVKELSIKDNTRKGLFSLSMGKLTANVRKFVGGNNSFDVQTPNAVAGVRGTGFEVVFAMVPQMMTNVTCTVGAMSVSSISATGAIISTTAIVAGQTAVVTSTGIVVSAATGAAGASGAAAGASGASGAGAGAGAGTAGAASGAAGAAGAAAGATAAAGVTVGTVAIGTAVAAAAVAAAVATTGGETTSTHHHTTTTHHITTTHHH